MVATKRAYGWKRDLPDHRDRFRALIRPEVVLPQAVDLRPVMPPVYDQKELGSCTANAIGAAAQYAQRKNSAFQSIVNSDQPNFVPSRLFIYYNERAIEGTIDEDSGAQIRDGMKAIARWGVCPEDSFPLSLADWPYDIARFRDKPPLDCYEFGQDHQAIIYERVPQYASQLRSCLASGYPVIFGFSVYESFESAEVSKTGDVPLPERSESLLGGHAVLAVGYDNQTQRFLVRNSWGESWGDHGYCRFPYEYLESRGLADDFWCLRRLE